MSNYADEKAVPRGPGAIPYVDIATGMFNALGIVTALYHRQRTGEGQKLETSLFSTGLALQAQTLLHIDGLDARQHAAERFLDDFGGRFRVAGQPLGEAQSRGQVFDDQLIDRVSINRPGHRLPRFSTT